jgi:putative aldouronate transport system substrate-binding protein
VSAIKSELVPAWKAAGGDQARKEFEEALAAG